MLNTKDFIGNVVRGRDVRVYRQEDQRIIRFTDHRGRLCEEFKVSLEECDRLMSEVSDVLAGGHGKEFRVDIKMDYYGALRAEVRSGFLVPCVSRLGLSPRYLTGLNQKLSLKGGPLSEA